VSEAPPAGTVNAGLATASASLRDTAKWLVGGVVGTAAAVFAGASLTNIGSLVWPDDSARILAALLGAALAFASLGVLAWRALTVLSIHPISFAQLAEAREGEIHDVAVQLRRDYPTRLPGNLDSFAAVKSKLDEENAKEAGAQDDKFMDDAANFLPRVAAEASFLRVHLQFENLKKILLPVSVGALVGFGAFAWGVNPPERPAPVPAGQGPFVVVSMGGGGDCDGAARNRPQAPGIADRSGPK
jgi:hypothetical protein